MMAEWVVYYGAYQESIEYRVDRWGWEQVGCYLPILVFLVEEEGAESKDKGRWFRGYKGEKGEKSSIGKIGRLTD